ncbi:hypothetical protein GCM10023100_54470 [Actinocorallia cavernae]|uniref:Uncharacterized protein n=2 Tax=Actinomycetes TaxID=1760 RepID=A0ABP8T1J7_9ACTN
MAVDTGRLRFKKVQEGDGERRDALGSPIRRLLGQTGDSAASGGPCRKAPRALYVESGKESGDVLASIFFPSRRLPRFPPFVCFSRAPLAAPAAARD